MKRKDGYVLDTVYPIFFYKEMQPIWLSSLVHFLGFKAPNVARSFSYLELACAQGTNLIVSAMQYPDSTFVGIDFNPAHIEQAQQSVKQLGLKNIEFIHSDFQQFLNHNTLKFDFIVNHGTFSWVAPQQQQLILEIVNQCLNEFGIFYLHYMCQPGSLALQPVQKLFNLVDQHTTLTSSDSIEVSKHLFNDLMAAGAFVNEPHLAAIARTLLNSHSYLAHELLTDHWMPLYSTDVHQQVFDICRMSYIASANPCDNLDSISIPENMQRLIQQTKAPAVKEYLKDLARNTKQRLDIFQKQPQALDAKTHAEALNQFDFKPLADMPPQGITYFETAIGKIQAPQALIAELMTQFRDQHINIAKLMQMDDFKNNTMFLYETLFLMLQSAYIYPTLPNQAKVEATCRQKFNQLMADNNVALKYNDQSPIPIYAA